ncbi:hypothetical protein DYB35_004208 [Aphanomyces astaci]|uniref:SUEL-type lectin domain-containing protein n=1 Tax=Aphanomyces astaci TaxID=112090 RepID=A0A3R6XUY8_APHAT|nr:hypothetical protein DYB35_004208 [Aphanomyces astaci]
MGNTNSSPPPPTPAPTPAPTAQPTPALALTPGAILAAGVAVQDTTLDLQCPDPSFRITRVLFASYGQPTGEGLRVKYGVAHALTSQSKVEAACLTNNACSVTASDATFGSPTAGTKKLAVTAECTQQVQYAAASKVAENSKLTLACESGYEIYGITAATYGLPKGTCSAWAPTGTSWQCVGDIYTPIRLHPVTGDVECMSLNHHDCIWKSSTLTCEKVLGTDESTLSPLACGFQHNKEWGQPGYNVTGNHWCETGRKMLTAPCLGSCNAASSYTVLNSVCLNQQTCTVPAHNTVFSDPCVGTVKSLAVSYRCRQTSKYVGPIYTAYQPAKCTTDVDLLLNFTLKGIFKRQRPSFHKDDMRFPGPDKYSFPSGHGTRAGALVALFSALLQCTCAFESHYLCTDRCTLVEPELLSLATAGLTSRTSTSTCLTVAWTWAAINSFGRLALGRHFVSDVVLGTAIGYALFFPVAQCVMYWTFPPSVLAN